MSREWKGGDVAELTFTDTGETAIGVRVDRKHGAGWNHSGKFGSGAVVMLDGEQLWFLANIQNPFRPRVLPPAVGRVHNHAPYRPVCNERDVDGQLRGACLNDDGSEVTS